MIHGKQRSKEGRNPIYGVEHTILSPPKQKPCDQIADCMKHVTPEFLAIGLSRIRGTVITFGMFDPGGLKLLFIIALKWKIPQEGC